MAAEVKTLKSISVNALLLPIVSTGVIQHLDRLSPPQGLKLQLDVQQLKHEAAPTSAICTHPSHPAGTLPSALPSLAMWQKTVTNSSHRTHIRNDLQLLQTEDALESLPNAYPPV
jgi:hypothetical protein